MTILASRAQLRASFFRWALFLVPLVMLLGFLSGEVSGSAAANPWFTALEKPAIYPPPATFGIVWSILYFMMGIAAALVCAAWGARGRTLALALFAMQLVLNLAWSPMFFREHQIELALYLLLAIDVAVLLTLIMFFVVRRLAGLLLVPYFAWVAFATVLNYQFWLLNPQAQDVEVTSPSQRIEL